MREYEAVLRGTLNKNASSFTQLVAYLLTLSNESLDRCYFMYDEVQYRSSHSRQNVYKRVELRFAATDIGSSIDLAVEDHVVQETVLFQEGVTKLRSRLSSSVTGNVDMLLKNIGCSEIMDPKNKWSFAGVRLELLDGIVVSMFRKIEPQPTLESSSLNAKRDLLLFPFNAGAELSSPSHDYFIELVCRVNDVQHEVAMNNVKRLAATLSMFATIVQNDS